MSTISLITKLADETGASLDEVGDAVDSLGADTLNPVAKNPDGFRKWLRSNPGLTVGGTTIGAVSGAYAVGEASSAYVSEQQSDIVRRVLTSEELSSEQKAKLIRKYQNKSDSNGSSPKGVFSELTNNLTMAVLAVVIVYLIAQNAFGGEE